MPGIALRAASLQGGGVPGTHPAFTFKRKRFSLMRASGILMPISSLPSAHGIGAMGAEARRFVEFLSKAGQAYWQILPICPTSYGDSPYQSFSTFAGNPYFIDLDELAKRGLLLPEEYENIDWESAPDTINYGALYEKRYKVLRCAANRLLAKPNAAYRKFVKENAFWLPDYALFMALKDAHGGACWLEWEEPLRRREPEALKAAREQYADDVAFWQVVQYLFYAQWNALKGYANRMKIDIIGDLPIYVALDSVDVWSCPQEFQLDENLLPTEVAGCPPDGFSATGQLWGNPLFDWDAMAKTGYAWWVRRIRHMCSIYDVVRIDHFRGFESYYSIPAGNKTATGGHWEKGPDRDFINAMHENLGEGGIIAEDLGYLTPEVKAMLSASGYPGMKIMQFAFDSRESGNYLPHTYHRNSVVYTGTHDNVTTEGWRTNASAEDVAYACRYLRCQPEELTEAMICACLASVSDTAVIPLADWLHLGSEARINTPSTQGSNWQWRLTCPLPEALAGHIAQLTVLYERAQ